MIFCDAHLQNNELCSWERDHAGEFIPTPEISYRSNDRIAEFTWVLYVGNGQLEAQINKSSDSKSATRFITLSGDGGNYRVRLQGINVDLE